MALDPSRANAQVTREVAKSLEGDGHPAHQVGAFLTRCLFSMFAEDVGLLPASDKGDGKGALSELLQTHRAHTPTLQRMLQALWTEMYRGGFNVAVQKEVLKFNGKLFKALQADGYALPLNRDQINSLLEAAKANWTEVETAIFGTLLARALDPACGNGNFLYVTLEHLKRLEGDVLNQIEALDAGQNSLNLEGEIVTLQQLLGIKLNLRAAALAELVLWIGYLQWQARTVGVGIVPGLDQHIRQYCNGRDQTASPRDVMVIDLFGLGADKVRQKYPAAYQWLVEKVKPERDQNNRKSH